MSDLLLCVDLDDKVLGKISKEEAHQKPILHRAFSVFLFDGNKILLQKRAKQKYHSAGLVANTCCSHPRGDDVVKDAILRLKFECGIETKNLQELFSFVYLTKFNDNLFEYELDHVLVGRYDGDFKPNLQEVEELFWVDIDTLKSALVQTPQKFASWFLICAPKVIKYIENLGKH